MKVELHRDPVKAENVIVKWDEPQVSDRPESSHMLVIGAYFDFARNHHLAKQIEALLASTPPNQEDE